ncbi:pentatricopeptide repeat-containing protein At1g08070, chloroplastic-like [Humulus lupulus]|uniref:pentatricopeptide repeat-containing protein At1g08070, chloroplastic-like n=1 Tax=Humulus lupulus TaxID=3486 RepID=UPI002B40B27C|nr:pentatricopeptide repeat-containing protein At1g08070, chloroplastic-like [Humulus lupulus]
MRPRFWYLESSDLVELSFSGPSSSGGLDYAVSVFRRIENPNPFMCFNLLKSLSDSPNPLDAISLFAHVLTRLEDWKGVEFSLPSVIKSCGRSHGLEEGKQVHGLVLKTHFVFDPYVANSMIRMYLEVGEVECARQLFDKMPERDVVSWNSMINGYLRIGKIELAREFFDKMPKRDLISYNAMIDGYGKSGKCELAEEIFGMTSCKDVKTWTSMISAYVFNHQPQKALDMFREMLSVGVKPDGPTLVSVLSAIADLGFVDEGKWIHTYISTNMIQVSFGFIGSALIDMYAKCGHIENAYEVFRRVSHNRNIGDWNCMISGLAIHGLGDEALKIFSDMEKMGIEPDEITFLGLLNACSHSGLVDEGQFFFKLMQQKYNIVPKLQHYGCIIDLLSRAGHFENALRILQNMPVEPDILAWKAILSASTKHGKVEIGEHAALRAIELAPEDSSSYVLLSNVYAKMGRWDDVAKVRLVMKQKRVGKVPGCSSILVKGKVHNFLAGMAMDEKCTDEVLSKIDEMASRLRLEGYKPALTQVLLDVEDEGKASLLSLHSEKMALAFGFANIKTDAPIHIVKNLRVCCDCHAFIKLVSKVYNRRIVVRDQNRFHHFENGFCSCKEYW